MIDPSAEHGDVEDVPASDPFVRRAAGVIAMIGVAALLGAIVVLGVDILLAGFGGLLISVLLVAVRDLVKRVAPLSDGWALAVGLLGILLLIAGGIWALSPYVADQADEIGQQLPSIAQQLEEGVQRYAWGQWVMEQIRNGRQDASGGVTSFLSGLSDWSTYLLTSVFVGLFAAAQPGLYRTGLLNLLPIRHRSRAGDLFNDIGHTLRWWLIGQALAMLVIGVSTTIVLLIFGIPMAIVLGLIVGLLGFIPYLGPIIGAVPVALIAATEGTDILIYVMVAYTIVQILEGYIATPLIQRETVYLPPVFTIMTQILLGTLLGLLGFILATPLAAVILVASKYYRAYILGDRAALE